MLKELISLANELDKRDLRKEADYLDVLIKNAIWYEHPTAIMAMIKHVIEGGAEGRLALTRLISAAASNPATRALIFRQAAAVAGGEAITAAIVSAEAGTALAVGGGAAAAGGAVAGGGAAGGTAAGGAAAGGAALVEGGAGGAALKGGGAAAAGGGGAAAATVGLVLVGAALIGWMGYEGYQAAVQTSRIKNKSTIKAVNGAILMALASASKRTGIYADRSREERDKRFKVYVQIQKGGFEAVGSQDLLNSMMMEVTQHEWDWARTSIRSSPLSEGGSGVELEKAQALYDELIYE